MNRTPESKELRRNAKRACRQSWMPDDDKEEYLNTYSSQFVHTAALS